MEDYIGAPGGTHGVEDNVFMGEDTADYFYTLSSTSPFETSLTKSSKYCTPKYTRERHSFEDKHTQPLQDLANKLGEERKKITGEQWVNEIKGIKEVEGKLDYSEINLEILDLMAERLSANKHKYPKGNMKKPLDIKGLEWALFRHIKKMIQPIENDNESYIEHLAAILCNSSMILDQIRLKDGNKI